MSLTQSDLAQIESLLDKKLDPVLGKLEALENDVKEIYYMIAKLEKSESVSNKFSKLSVEQKILKMYKELKQTAKEAGVNLPN